VFTHRAPFSVADFVRTEHGHAALGVPRKVGRRDSASGIAMIEEVVREQRQCRDRQRCGEHQLSAVAHDSQVCVFSGNNRGDRRRVGRWMSRPLRCQGVTHSIASSNVVKTPTADAST
jgi:hypothetical protein